MLWERCGCDSVACVQSSFVLRLELPLNLCSLFLVRLGVHSTPAVHYMLAPKLTLPILRLQKTLETLSIRCSVLLGFPAVAERCPQLFAFGYWAIWSPS